MFVMNECVDATAGKFGILNGELLLDAWRLGERISILTYRIVVFRGVSGSERVCRRM